MRKTLILLFLSLIITGCDRENNELQWKEDVLLQDGRVITLNRKAQYGAPRDLTQKRLGVSWYSVDFQHPTTKEKIHWEAKMMVDSEEMHKARVESWEIPPALRLDAILIKDDTIFIVADLGIRSWLMGCPNPPFFLYKWESGRWRKVKLEDIPYRKFSVNVQDDLNGAYDVIERYKYHVPLEITTQQVYGNKPYVIDLTRMQRQELIEGECPSIETWISNDTNSN